MEHRCAQLVYMRVFMFCRVCLWHIANWVDVFSVVRLYVDCFLLCGLVWFGVCTVCMMILLSHIS